MPACDRVGCPVEAEYNLSCQDWRDRTGVTWRAFCQVHFEHALFDLRRLSWRSNNKYTPLLDSTGLAWQVSEALASLDDGKGPP